MKRYLAVFTLVICALSLSAQDQTNYTSYTFKDTRVVNGHSIETNEKGQMKMIISHRFGRINDGIDELYGLDQSTIRIGFDYGINDWLTVGFGRSSFEKTVDGLIKVKLLRQSEGAKNVPFTLTGLSTIAIKTIDFPETDRDNLFTSRLFYTYQLLVARKISDRLSLQLMPTLVHRNLVATTEDENDIISIGGAGSFQLTKSIAFKAEYYYNLPDQLADGFYNPLSLGFDIETKNHVFQLHLSNSRGMIEKFFITETTGQWDAGDIHFGFNITRDFQIAGKKYK